jgi:hypothetical protein
MGLISPFITKSTRFLDLPNKAGKKMKKFLRKEKEDAQTGMMMPACASFTSLLYSSFLFLKYPFFRHVDIWCFCQRERKTAESDLRRPCSLGLFL